ncbi:MAG: hypothetical protein QN155_02300 [Armatimonadota bacterium]|nr:hypothetical protein [Armatimonadota bacterium]MDR7403256.1 hypothetical protein [Armatimonadota bacterium]
MSVLVRGQIAGWPGPRRSLVREVFAGVAAWRVRMADDREMVGVKLLLLAAVVALALFWEVPDWAP